MKKDISKNTLDNVSFSPELQKEVFLLEEESKQELEKFLLSLKNVKKNAAKTLEEILEESDLNLEDKNKTKEVFEKTILQGLEEVEIKILKPSLEKKEKLPFTVNLLKAVINVLEIIQDFKKKIDKVLPITCDKIIKYVIPILYMVIDICAPGVGLTLKNMSILEIAASSLRDDNLKSTIHILKSTLEVFSEQKGLEVIAKTVDLSVETAALPTKIAKLNLKYEILGKVVQGVVEIPVLKTFVKDLISYADQVFPQSQKAIDDTLEYVKKSAISAIEKAGAGKELAKKIEQQIDKHILGAKESLQKTLDPAIDLFNKIEIQQNSANKISDSVKDVFNTINLNMSDHKNAALVKNAYVEALQNGIKDRLRGDVAQIDKQVKNPQVKDFAKKMLGADHANLMDVAKGATMQLMGIKSSIAI